MGLHVLLLAGHVAFGRLLLSANVSTALQNAPHEATAIPSCTLSPVP